MFYDGFDAVICSYEVTKDGMYGFDFQTRKDVKLKIKVLDADSIQIRGKTIYRSESKQKYSYLFRTDTKIGKPIIETVKEEIDILHKDGAVEKRIYSYPWQSRVLQKIKVTLNCKNNILLEEMIDIRDQQSENRDENAICGIQIKIGKEGMHLEW